MTEEDTWVKIKQIKQEIDIYEINIQKINKRITKLEKTKDNLNKKLPGLWEKFKELYNKHNDQEKD